jgi:type IX secretion system PorP/SprF family membrane protein
MKRFITHLKTQLAALMLIPLCSFGQDVRLTQAFAVPMNLNPAIMGANTDFMATANYRNQWSSIENGYQTYNLSLLYPLFLSNGKQKLDFGLLALNDAAGAFTTLDISLSVSYSIRLSESYHHLSVAFQGGYVQKSLDAANLTFDDQYTKGSYDALNPSNETIVSEQLSYPDAGAGLMWYYNPSKENGSVNGYFGVSAFHINQPNESFTGEASKLPMRYACQTGIKIFGNNGMDFIPNVRISSQSGATELAPGLYVNYNLKEGENGSVTFGTWYRQRDAIAFLIGFDHKSFKIGYSYDLGNSLLNKTVSGLNIHEITLSYKLNRAKEYDVNPSPFSSF